MLHHIRILPVLVIRSGSLNHALDSIDGARDAIASDELGQIPMILD